MSEPEPQNLSPESDGKSVHPVAEPLQVDKRGKHGGDWQGYDLDILTVFLDA